MNKLNTPQEKPWGFSKTIYQDDFLIVNEITIHPNYSTSYHKHLFKSEAIKVISNNAEVAVSINGDLFKLHTNDKIYFRPGDIHSICNWSNKNPVTIFQFIYGVNLDIKDKVILYDYNHFPESLF